MRLNTISRTLLLLMLAFSASFGSSEREHQTYVVDTTKQVSAAASAYGKGKDLVSSMNAKKESFNEEQLTLLKQAEDLQIDLKYYYEKTIDVSHDATTIEEVEEFSSKTAAIYEQIEAINDQTLALTSGYEVPIAPPVPSLPTENVVDNIINITNDSINNTLINVMPPEVPVITPPLEVPIIIPPLIGGNSE